MSAALQQGSSIIGDVKVAADNEGESGSRRLRMPKNEKK
jgi:hypothetical protein